MSDNKKIKCKNCGHNSPRIIKNGSFVCANCDTVLGKSKETGLEYKNPYDKNGRYYFTGMQVYEFKPNLYTYKTRIIWWEWNSCDGFSYYGKTGKKLKRIPKEAEKEINSYIKKIDIYAVPQ